MELSSSSDVEMVSITNRENPTTRHTECTSTPDTQCLICFSEVINKCHSNSCEHLFCFLCLKRWSKLDPSCPFCKSVFIRIYHSFTEQGTHATYDVPKFVIEYKFNLEIFSEINRTHTHNLHYDAFMMNSSIQRHIMGQASRTRVYVENTWANPLPDSSGNFRDCSLQFYRNNPSQMNILQDFILRDLIAVIIATNIGGGSSIILKCNEVSLIQCIMRSILCYEIREPYILDAFKFFLGVYTRQFFHELFNYAYSPYDMIDYDRYVQYTLQTSINTTSSSAIGHLNDLNSPPSSHLQLRSGPIPEVSPWPINNETSSLMDQPSTSTGIRDSLDRPNIRKRKLVSSTGNESSSTPEHVKRSRPILDSSSNDETSLEVD